MAVTPDWNRPNYEPSKRRLTWQNGAIATLFSAEEPDRLRGPNHDLAWCDELASWQNQQATWDNLQMTLRLGERPRGCISTTPKPSKLLRDLVSREGKDVVITRGKTLENRANLAPSFLNQILRKYEGTRLGRQEIGAELLEDVEGALWSLDMIERARIPAATIPDLTRIVVISIVALLAGLDGAAVAQQPERAATATPLVLVSGWVSGPFGTANPAVIKVGGVVHFEGAMATSGTNP
jgi:phage terminase large subunit-like protein